jgi:gamma-glutamyl phosphate reductase
MKRKAHGTVQYFGYLVGVLPRDNHIHTDRDITMYCVTYLAVDSKCDYPAACNAMETLLVHRSLLRTSALDKVINALRERGVSYHGNIYTGKTKFLFHGMELFFGNMLEF